jgi:hypothetical protein
LWSAIDTVLQFRVPSPEEFESGVPLGYLLTNVVFAFAGGWLIRRSINRSMRSA